MFLCYNISRTLGQVVFFSKFIIVHYILKQSVYFTYNLYAASYVLLQSSAYNLLLLWLLLFWINVYTYFVEKCMYSSYWTEFILSCSIFFDFCDVTISWVAAS